MTKQTETSELEAAWNAYSDYDDAVKAAESRAASPITRSEIERNSLVRLQGLFSAWIIELDAHGIIELNDDAYGAALKAFNRMKLEATQAEYSRRNRWRRYNQPRLPRAY